MSKAKKEIYLDDFATSRVFPEVASEIKKYQTEGYGNPSSLHELGEKASDALKKAREEIAKEINCHAGEIVFTSGATESDNLAIQGLARHLAKQFPAKKRIVISAIEHPAVNETCNFLKSEGYKIIKIPVGNEGILNLELLEKKIKKSPEKVLLVSVMHVNNVIGVIQDIEKIGRICGRYKVLFHTDATQSFGKTEIDVKKQNIGMLSASAHKIGGPKGIGFLYLKHGIEISPLIFGGGQERNLRSGTENVPGIMGFAKALETYKKIMNKEKIERLRNEIINRLENLGGRINGPKGENKRIYNNIHISFPGIDGENLVSFLSGKGIYVSAGSACDSRKQEEDHALKAIGLEKKQAESSIRISLGPDFKDGDVSYFIRKIKNALDKLRICA